MFFAHTQIKELQKRVTKFISPHHYKDKSVDLGSNLPHSLEVIKDLQWLGEQIFNHDVHKISNQKTTL